MIEKHRFVSPVVIKVKKNKTVEIALDAHNLNESGVKKRPYMPDLEELSNEISGKLNHETTQLGYS